jgi:NAD(P)H-dependent FMN reductase
MNPPSIVGLCGSLRDQSTTRTALKRALTAADHAGGNVSRIDLRDVDLPTYDGDEPDAGDALLVRERVRAADGLILGTPVYHATIASPLKVALDYCRREDIEDTTVGLVCTAGGRFYGPVFSHLRSIIQILDGWTLPRQVAIPNAGSVISGETITDDEIDARLATLGEALVAYARLDKTPEMTADPAVMPGD